MNRDLLHFETPGRVAFVTQGCKVNQYETQRLRESFLDRGWQELSFGEKVDLVVINSCTVTSGSDRDLRKLVNRSRRNSPEAKILVTGCRVEVDPDGAGSLVGVDMIAGNFFKASLAGVLGGEEWKPADDNPDRVEGGLISGMGGRGRALLKVQDGCNLRCSYCIVPRARGASRSRSAEETVRAARRLGENGFSEIVLTGIQLGLYRDPEGRAADLAGLLDVLLRETEGLRYRLGSILPRHVSDEMIELFAGHPDRLCPHLHVSLQSGDDAVLEKMNRPYSAGYFLERMEKLVLDLDDPCLGTDIIVGHPGEDDAAFEATRRLVQESPLSQGHVFPFSPRPGTRAAEWGDPVSPRVKSERSRVLRELFAEKAAAYRERQQGRRLRVVAEKHIEDGRWRGTSENYQTVFFDAPEIRRAEIVDVEIRGIEGERLVGSAVVRKGIEA